MPPHIERLKNRYIALAQAEGYGEYLFIVFALESGVATIITARPMTDAEQRRFRKIRGR